MQSQITRQATGGAVVITGATNIKLAQMVAQRAALNLERRGLARSHGSVYAMIKRVYGLRGNRESVYTQFCELIEQYKLENGYHKLGEEAKA